MLMGQSVSLPVLLFYCSVVNGNMYDHCSMLVCLHVRAFVLHATIREKSGEKGLDFWWTPCEGTTNFLLYLIILSAIMFPLKQ